MIYNSPWPDVEVPDLPLTAYVLAGAAGRGISRRWSTAFPASS